MSTIEDWLLCVGKGWHPLIQQLAADLGILGWDEYIAQVKEKFGGLRFYIGSGTDEMFNLIDRAEAKSLTICEECGEPGRLREQRGWYKTRCEEHKDI